MRFVRALCDVAEAMRGVDGSSRPARLRKELEALPRRTPLAHAPFEKAGRLGRVARVPPREGHVFKTKARAPTLVLLETVDDPDADTTCLREEDSESDDEKPSRRMESFLVSAATAATVLTWDFPMMLCSVFVALRFLLLTM